VVDLHDGRSRRPTEELTMQVNVSGAWHRRTPDLKTTACGEAFHAQFAAVRREALHGALCRVCFTSYELGQAEKTNQEENP
jgi:hypothetical protein